VVDTLQREHGDRWRSLIATNGAAWLQLADDAASDTDDLYDGRLGAIACPVLSIHGARDPRTEPGEFDALRAALRPAVCEVCVLPDGGHSPHSERATAGEVTSASVQFFATMDAREAADALAPRRS
jgi:pimeloyl-ACP methyl ester carboxylesterase